MVYIGWFDSIKQLFLVTLFESDMTFELECIQI